MDKTKTYIKMSDHPLIQGQWERLEGDYFYGKGWWGFAKVMILFDANSCCAVLPQEDATWLPRQDQIQGMIFNEQEGVQTIANRIADFSTSRIGTSISIQGTMEQLWLVFYMHEKHGLTWDSDEWRDNG